ncbi:MAG: DUF4070 domain-containing protein, partial [Deltaproteobacteria bacterium]|nr:DUF4070 domain-containing protein [Deltaproteobacteria bacterium]
FWPYLLGIALHNRRDLFSYLGLCGHFEHFYEFRGIVEREIAQQLEARQRGVEGETPGDVVKKGPPSESGRQPRGQ